jgi:ABC-type multidrug transport system fused ATPase/permease subunit
MRDKGLALLDQSQRPVYMLYTIQQWLTLVLDLVVGAMAVILIAMVTSLRNQFNAASIGVALNLLLTLNQTLANAIKMWTMTETSIGAVTRVQRFIQDTPSEGCCITPSIISQLPDDWPGSGVVEFRDVTAGYKYVPSRFSRIYSALYILSHLQLLLYPDPQRSLHEHQAGREYCSLRAVWKWKDITDHGDAPDA